MSHNQGPLWYERADRTAVVFGWRNRVGMDYPSVAGIAIGPGWRLSHLGPWLAFPGAKRDGTASWLQSWAFEVSLSMPGTRAVSQWYFGITLGLYLSVFEQTWSIYHVHLRGFSAPMVGILESRIGRAHTYASHRLHGQRTENQFGVTSEVPHFRASSIPILFFFGVAFKRQNRSTYPYASCIEYLPTFALKITQT